MRAGISADQIAVRELGKETQFASLELAAEPMPTGISYKGPTTPLPVETNPRVLFERLFGDGDSIDPKAMAAHNREDQSILDLVREDISGLSRNLGAGDRRKLDEYLESIRDIERRIEIAEQRMSNVDVPSIRRPAGVPDLYPDYVKLMFDLQVLALQADLTRVWTFMLGKEASVMTYIHIGIPDAHHEITHHAGHQDKIEGVTKINTHHVDLFGYLLRKMDAMREGDGSLLDHSLVLYGSDMSNGNHHNQHNLPLVLAGGAAGRRTSCAVSDGYADDQSAGHDAGKGRRAHGQAGRQHGPAAISLGCLIRDILRGISYETLARDFGVRGGDNALDFSRRSGADEWRRPASDPGSARGRPRRGFGIDSPACGREPDADRWSNGPRVGRAAWRS